MRLESLVGPSFWVRCGSVYLGRRNGRHQWHLVAVLKVLSLADAVRGDEEINLAVLRHGRNLGTVFGARGEVREDIVITP